MNEEEKKSLLQLAKQLAQYDEKQRADIIYWLIKLATNVKSMEEIDGRIANLENRTRKLEEKQPKTLVLKTALFIVQKSLIKYRFKQGFDHTIFSMIHLKNGTR